MNEQEPVSPDHSKASVIALRARGRRRSEPPAPARSSEPIVSFDRKELRILLNLYGGKVAEGEWKDYALDFTASKAVFSVFRRSCEAPLYRIEKTPALARRQGAFAVVAVTGLVLRRGQDLARVVAVLERKLTLVGAD